MIRTHTPYWDDCVLLWWMIDITDCSLFILIIHLPIYCNILCYFCWFSSGRWVIFLCRNVFCISGHAMQDAAGLCGQQNTVFHRFHFIFSLVILQKTIIDDTQHKTRSNGCSINFYITFYSVNITWKKEKRNS